MTSKQVETYANALQTAPSKRAKRARSRWQYSGDVDLRQGGFYFRDDDSDLVEFVEIIPESVAGGPDNIFRIEVGDIFIPEQADRRKSALEFIGADLESPARGDLLHAFCAYEGIEIDSRSYVQVGFQVDEFWQGEGRGYVLPKIDHKLRSNASLRTFVQRTFLR
jgi:hypothetical protein